MKHNHYSYQTVSEAMIELAKRGYTTDFSILPEKQSLAIKQTPKQHHPEQYQTDEIYRIEGNTDPGDEMIVYAISSIQHALKGIVVNAYGMYSDSSVSKIVSKLHCK